MSTEELLHALVELLQRHEGDPTVLILPDHAGGWLVTIKIDGTDYTYRGDALDAILAAGILQTADALERRISGDREALGAATSALLVARDYQDCVDGPTRI